MPLEEFSYIADWMRIAEKDLARVEKLIEYDDPELAGFCLQLAVEKFLKAYLLSKGWQLRRIHNLDTLIDDTLAFDQSFAQFRKICVRITAFYFVERYPFLDIKITKQDVQICLQEISPLIQKIRCSI